MTFAIIFTAALVIVVVVGFLINAGRRDKAWKQLAADLGAEFISGSAFKSSQVQAHFQPWTVTLDAYSVPSGDSSVTYTRIRAPFQNAAAFEFRIVREGIVAKLDKALGMKDIEIGVADFDDDFIIQSNNEARVQALLSDVKIRQLLQAERKPKLSLKGDQLLFETQGLIRDVPRLKSLFELLRETLTQLKS